MPLTQRRFTVFLALASISFLVAISSTNAQAQGGLGSPLPNLAPSEAKAFTAGQSQFFRLWGVQEGLGPLTSDGGCSRCHKQPVIGGGAARLLTFYGLTNPDGSFDQFYLGGPFLQPLSNAPFIKSGLCTLQGEQVPVGATVEKRLTAPVFGFGLVDAIADADILNQAAFELNNYQADGIHGVANMVLDYHQVLRPGRFGRKAQQPTLLQQVAAAFGHDLGITNPLVKTEDCPQGDCNIDPNCTDNTPVPNNTNTGSGGKGIFNISHFARFLAPAAPQQTNLPGQTIFMSIGCNECHLPSYQTPAQVFYDTDLSGTQFGPSPSLSNQLVNLYSDLLLHDMGKKNAGTFPANTLITNQATQQQWRTTPLWGIFYRTAFWHNGSIKDIPSAILQHSPDGTGEAAAVLGKYQALSPSDQAALVAFVQSL
ncbi:MAG: hypothetical protein LAO03_03700 [Acidobacteriia bacterium]|nr:hypothetical protein [Terriglobia bacterium]